MDSEINSTVLPNGLTVISEWVPGIRSVCSGIWVKAGSRLENEKNKGTAHFLEHMVFKGTAKRSAFKIAHTLEEAGGSLNAFTAKEYTVFYAHTLDTRLNKSINVLADLVCNPVLRDSDLQSEKQVVSEEIHALLDTPEDHIFDLFQEKLFPEQGLGYPILGTDKSVGTFNSKSIVRFWDKYYAPANMILTVAGNVEHKKLLRLAKRYFNCNRSSEIIPFEKPRSTQNVSLEFNQPVNQCHLVTGGVSVPYKAKERFAVIALNTYLGGGMSSRLFQQIREKYGLVYSVYSYADFFSDAGMISFYLGSDTKNKEKALDLLQSELFKITKSPLKKSVVEYLKNQLKGHLLLSLESTYSRMSRLAKNEIYFHRQCSLDKINVQIDRLDEKILLETAQKIFKINQFNTITIQPNA